MINLTRQPKTNTEPTANPKGLTAGAGEAASKAVETGATIKRTAADTINRMKETISTRGNTVAGEIKRLGTDYIGSKGIYGSAIKTPLKAAHKLLTLSPLQAVREVAEGAGKTLGNLADIGFAPARIGVAGGEAFINAAKKTASLPAAIAKSPLKVFGAIQSGIGKFDKYMSAGAPIQATK
jgi:hypothetical protein